MSAAKCQFPFSYRRKSEEAMTAVIWLGCSRCFPLCQWNSSPSSSNEIANSQVAVLVLCIGFIGFDKLSSVCKIYLSNQAAEGAILLHSPDPSSPPRMASFATNQPTNHMGKKARAQKPSWKGVRDDMNDDESFWLFINSSSRFYHHYGSSSSIICVDSFFLDSKNAFFNSWVLSSIPKCGCRETCKIGLHYSSL